MSVCVDLTLPAAPASARVARRAVDRLRLPAELADAIALLVTELVSNSVRHARQPASGRIDLHLEADSRGVRGAVSDKGPGFEADSLEHRDLETPGGLGLVLVERLADRWGVARDAATTVWFEVDRLHSATTRLPLWTCATPHSTAPHAPSHAASPSSASAGPS